MGVFEDLNVDIVRPVSHTVFDLAQLSHLGTAGGANAIARGGEHNHQRLVLQQRLDLWGLIREVNGRGVTVVMTTHYMEEAETLCNRLAIMDHGQILALDTPRSLINQLKASYAVKLTLDKPMTVAQLESLNGGVELVHSEEQSEETADEDAKAENTYLLRLANSPTALRSMLDEIDKAGLGLENLQITPVTLEDVFLEMTGSELRD